MHITCTRNAHCMGHAHTSAPRRRAAAAPGRGGTRTLTPVAVADITFGRSEVGRSDSDDFGPPSAPTSGEKSAWAADRSTATSAPSKAAASPSCSWASSSTMNRSMPRSSLRSRSGLSSPLRSTAPQRSNLSRDASRSFRTTARMPSSSSSPLSCPLSLSCPTTLTPMRPAAWVTVTTSGAASRTNRTASTLSAGLIISAEGCLWVPSVVRGGNYEQ